MRKKHKDFLDSPREVIVEVMGIDEVASSVKRTALGESGHLGNAGAEGKVEARGESVVQILTHQIQR